MEKSSNKVTNEKPTNLIGDDTAVSIEHWSSGLDDVDDSTLYFSPDLGNVVFASAIDGWGFSIDDFAAIYSKKLGLRADILQKTLWGDFYLDPKSKRIFKKAQSKGKKPLFVQFILQNIWSIYDAVVIRRDKLKIEQIAQSLNVKISARDSRSSDPRVKLQAILGKWLSLSSVVLNMVVDKLPSPLEIEEDRVEKLLSSGLRTYESLPDKSKNLKQAFLSCSSNDDAPVIVFVSKMVAVDDRALPKHKKRPLTQEEIAERRQRAREKHEEMLLNSKHEEFPQNTSEFTTQQEEENVTPTTHFIAFARVYSGMIKKGQTLYILGPRHDPATVSDKETFVCDEGATENKSSEGLAITQSVDLGMKQDMAVFTVDDLYLLMGRELEALHDVPAGNVLGIGGLHNHVLKSATVSSTVMCPPFTSLHIEARPIVRVAVEPVHYADLPALSRGIRLLNQADPCVETFMARTGEHVIVAAGEVHLQKCVDDLKERFACVPFYVSSPIIPFRETVIPPPKIDMVNEAISGDAVAVPKTDINLDVDKTLVEITTANKKCNITIRAIPLPGQITNLLDANTETIKLLVNGKYQCKEEIKSFYNELKELFDEEDSITWNEAVDKIWAFGPSRTGPNILLNRIPDYNRPSIWPDFNTNTRPVDPQYRNYDNSILSGFQLATLAGPLCEEPLMGVCFVIENITTDLSNTDQTCSTRPNTDTKTADLEDQTILLAHNAQENVSVDSINSEVSPEEKHQIKTEFTIDRFGPFSGQLMSTVKEGCRRAFQLQAMRLMAAMYTCHIQTTAEVLGRMYAVIGKREGRVLSETMMEGSDVFDVVALLPVAESFGFSEEIRKRTSGLANPQLVFSHWEVIDIDPYWVPTTEEEYTHFGAKADSDNQARKYMNTVRKRKGLYVEEKTVEHAEKQRTLKK